MRQTRAERTEKACLPATASGRSIGSFPLGSEQSRAAARFLLNARTEGEAAGDWDREPDCTGIAEFLAAARQRAGSEEVLMRDWSPIHVPPGKENTIRGRLVLRINAARARMARFEAEERAER